MSQVPSTLLDRYELTFLAGLRDQEAVLSRVRAQTASGINGIATGTVVMPSPTTMTATTTPASGSSTPADSAYSDAADLADDAGGIVNRSPVTTNNYHYYPQTTTTTTPATVTPALVTPAPTPAPTKTGLSPWWLLLIPLLLGLGGLTWYLTKKPTTPVATAPPENWTGQTTIKLGDAP